MVKYINFGMNKWTKGPVNSAENKVPSRTPSIAEKFVRIKDKITAVKTKKLSKNVFTKLNDLLTIGWNTLRKYSPGTIHTEATTDKEILIESKTVPVTIRTQDM